MSFRRQLPKSPGGPPLHDQRALYIELVSNGATNTQACEIVGVNRRTGTRWTRGRTVVNRAGKVLVYAPIITEQRADSGRFLNAAERAQIADGLLAGDAIRAIAVRLNRSPSTVSREIRRNREADSGRYLPYGAHRRALQRRTRRRAGKLATNAELRAVVQARLDERWSPEQIANSLAAAFGDRPEMRVCQETIYQALYSAGRADLHRSPVRVLRTGRSRRRPHRRVDRRTTRFVEPMRMISDRPLEAAARAETGHWEGDLLMGTKNRSAIGTVVERRTRFTILLHLPAGHTAEQLSAALIESVAALPEQLRRSLTWDQGSEMACHGDVTAATGLPVYFCDPGSPWQRPTNENTNGLLRQYFPKGTNLRSHDAAMLAAVAQELNRRPRKTLGWQTPEELLHRLKADSSDPPMLR
jgi:IS30 family transposase